MAKRLIPSEAIPEQAGEIVSIDGKGYLMLNDAMYTFYRRSMGELTPFFLGLRDDKKILGSRCTSCGIVRVPPFATRCPDCNFAPTELVEVGDVGRMLNTPPITYFANALFQQQVPFGRGRVVLEGADTAISVNIYTSKGILVPGLITRDTEVKLVFRRDRTGEISDFFCLPTSELTPEQVAQKGLEEGDVDWETATEPRLQPSSPEDHKIFSQQVGDLRQLAVEMNGCERAQRDIAGWQRDIQVKSRGGNLVMRLSDGSLEVAEGETDSPDFVMVCDDLSVLTRSLAYQGSLTQAIINRDLWISKNGEFTTVFKLERMARSLARSRKG
jgi:uncharacterized OB-fold protein